MIRKKRKPIKRSNPTKKLTRQQQYEDIRWKNKRESIFRRDGYKCQHKSCNHQEGEHYELCCHHKKYGRGYIWDVPDEWLITWCTYIHGVHHGRDLSRKLKKPPK